MAVGCVCRRAAPHLNSAGLINRVLRGTNNFLCGFFKNIVQTQRGHPGADVSPAAAKVGGSMESRRRPSISDSHLQLKDLPARHRFLSKNVSNLFLNLCKPSASTYPVERSSTASLYEQAHFFESAAFCFH